MTESLIDDREFATNKYASDVVRVLDELDADDPDPDSLPGLSATRDQ